MEWQWRLQESVYSIIKEQTKVSAEIFPAIIIRKTVNLERNSSQLKKSLFCEKMKMEKEKLRKK